jgi:hypothetical protein
VGLSGGLLLFDWAAGGLFPGVIGVLLQKSTDHVGNVVLLLLVGVIPCRLPAKDRLRFRKMCGTV